MRCSVAFRTATLQDSPNLQQRAQPRCRQPHLHFVFQQGQVRHQLLSVQPHRQHQGLEAGGLNGFQAGLLVDAGPQDVPAGGGRQGRRGQGGSIEAGQQASKPVCCNAAVLASGNGVLDGCCFSNTDLAVAGTVPRSASSAVASAMPVASGTTSAAPTSFIPATSSACAASRWVRRARRLEPAALGCSAAGDGGGGQDGQSVQGHAWWMQLPHVCWASNWHSSCTRLHGTCEQLGRMTARTSPPTCCDVARPSNAVREAVVPACHQLAGHPRLPLADPNVVHKIVAVHSSRVLQDKGCWQSHRRAEQQGSSGHCWCRAACCPC